MPNQTRPSSFLLCSTTASVFFLLQPPSQRDRVHGLLFGAIDVVDADVRNWSRNEGPAAGIATRVHDGLEGARGHLRAAV